MPIPGQQGDEDKVKNQNRQYPGVNTTFEFFPKRTQSLLGREGIKQRSKIQHGHKLVLE